MFKILNKKVLHENILQFTLEAPLIARKAEPGQFVVLRVNEYGERVPLIIVDFDRMNCQSKCDTSFKNKLNGLSQFKHFLGLLFNNINFFIKSSLDIFPKSVFFG